MYARKNIVRFTFVVGFQCHIIETDQDKIQNRLIDKVQNQIKERRQDSRQDSGHNNCSYARYAEKFLPKFIEICIDLVLVPIMGTKRATGNQQKHLSLSFATKA